jgi:hypothetical protein
VSDGHVQEYVANLCIFVGAATGEGFSVEVKEAVASWNWAVDD